MNLKDQNITEPTGEFAAAIHDFRAAVTHVADRETARPVAADWLAPARKRRSSYQHRVVLAWACAAALCCATLPFAIHSGPVPANHASLELAPAPIHRPGAVSDSTLLEQVDAEVSESVPSSLAPLTELDTWNTASNSSDPFFDGAALVQQESTNAAH